MDASITSRGMLINLAVSTWVARTHDRAATREVTAAHGAAEGAGWFNKTLMPADALKDVRTAVSRLRDHHYEQTLPWSDKGYRILPAANYFPYTERHNSLAAAFDVAVREFVARYADYTEEARAQLGSLFSPADYPSPRHIGAKFDVSLSVIPLPNGDDFRVDLGDEASARLAREIEARTHAALEEATRDIWHRLSHAVEDLRDRLVRLDDQDDIDGRKARMKSSGMTNLRELVELLPRLNITSDAQLDAMGERLRRSICQADPAELRVNPNLRQDVTNEANDILRAMAGYLAHD